MKKSLISKISLALVLVSASTQMLAMDLGRSKIKQLINNNPVAKSALISGVSIVTTVAIQALLSRYQHSEYEMACNGFGMGYTPGINKDDYVSPIMNTVVGLSGGFMSGILAGSFSDKTIDGLYILGGTGLAVATAVGIAASAGIINLVYNGV